MAKKVYVAEDHKRAYDAYYLSRNFSDVSRSTGISFETILRWKAANFVCNHGCPWHGWDQRIEEEVRVLAAKNKAIENGVLDPVAQAEAIQVAIDGGDPFLAPAPTKENVLDALRVVNTDKERLYHWQLLRSKVYFELTGIPLDYATSLGDSLSGKEPLLREEIYKKGLRATKFEDTVRILKLCDEEIERLEARVRGEEAKTLTVQAQHPMTTKDSPLGLPNGLSSDALRKLLEGVDSVEEVSE